MFEFPSEFLPYVSIVLVIWLLIDIYRGYKRGLILQVVDLVSTFVALFAAWILAPVFEKIYSFVEVSGNGYVTISQLVGQQANRLIWVVVLFIIIRIALLVIKPIASLISKMPLVKQVNSSVGGVFSILYFFIKLVILTVILTTPVVKNGNEVIEKTPLKYVQQVSEPIVEQVFDFIGRNEAFQSILFEQRLSDSQAASLETWLKSKGFTNNEIKEFLKNYE